MKFPSLGQLKHGCRASADWQRPNRRFDIQRIRGIRNYKVLAIESSCDDSAACIIERNPSSPPVLIDHMKSTLDSSESGGIIPIDALSHHILKLGPLVEQLMARNGSPKIDMVCATQGPGMYSSLAAGLQLAKGLAIAWNVPFVPVHHMLGHLLTPRFFSGSPPSPEFPFVSLLLSGGHSLLAYSESLTHHRILADTIDNAAGNALDKCARQLGMTGTMLGKELDRFTSCENAEFAALPDDFAVPMPLEKTHNGTCTWAAFSFAHYASLVPRIAQRYGWTPLQDQPEALRRSLAAALMDSMFDHITRKTAIALKKLREENPGLPSPLDLICAGGVASSLRLRTKLEQVSGSLDIRPHFVEPKWCTDNALMIGWAGIELWENGAKPNLYIEPRPKWPIAQLLDQ